MPSPPTNPHRSPHCGTASWKRVTLAGFPATVQFAGTDLLTSVPAPIMALSPIVISPNKIAPAKILTLSPMVGEPFSVCPMVTCWLI